jgi:phosphatidylserine/phosphatidylglycerophosphate/cardiolipin synthase-like enzyme
VFTEALRKHPDLYVIAVIPLHPDLDGALSRRAQLLGRQRSMLQMLEAAPDRVAVYGVENHRGDPVYVHAKACVVDDTWATVGSDNFNRRSWTHDSELSAVVVDLGDEPTAYARRLRLTLAAEHLDRDVDEESLLERMADCVDAAGMFTAFADSAARLQEWHDGGQRGERPPGRLRRVETPELGRLARGIALLPYLNLHDPDGRPGKLKRQGGF